jgi:hypothetical protein
MFFHCLMNRSIARQALRVWSNLAISNMTKDTDLVTQKVPFLQILATLGEKLEATTSRKIDAKSQDFLASVIDILPEDSIDITQFSKFWSWYYTTGRVIQHPGVRPLFRDGFVCGNADYQFTPPPRFAHPTFFPELLQVHSGLHKRHSMHEDVGR